MMDAPKGGLEGIAHQLAQHYPGPAPHEVRLQLTRLTEQERAAVATLLEAKVQRKLEAIKSALNDPKIAAEAGVATLHVEVSGDVDLAEQERLMAGGQKDEKPN